LSRAKAIEAARETSSAEESPAAIGWLRGIAGKLGWQRSREGSHGRAQKTRSADHR
jgi:hypothetical protein